jgi:phosphoglucomutase
MDPITKRRVEEWQEPPFDAETIGEIKELVQANNEKELTDRFYQTLEFGTGGLRGVIGTGTNRMNVYTVGMTTQGLADYISNKGEKKKGVIIAYDSRRMSDVFSRETASILAANGIKVYIFDDITPTPICSFAIRELNAQSGIVITASHNPPEYSGYKVYWEDGGQIVPPQDNEIIERVKEIDTINRIKKIDFNDGIKDGIITIIGDEIRNSYIQRLEGKALRKKKESDLKIVYTPLHGTGYRLIPMVLNHFGFNNISPVEEQSKPDGNFPTVKYPNPEEREALHLALELAKECDADLIMATDPDADRMGIGFKGHDGNYQLINGNQIGTMLEYYLLKRLSSERRLPANSSIIKTIVTTDLQEEIALRYNCSVENVLTGFKWIARRMRDYDNTGERTFIFGGEESYGYLPVDFVRDKDAVSSCYFFAEMADWLMENGRTLNEFLKEIYLEFGLYLEDLHSLTLKGKEGMEKIKRIMEEFRSNPPGSFADEEVIRIDDIQRLKTIDRKTGEEETIEMLPPSNVLQFFLGDRTKITMRPSGTEPKIKFYFSVNERADENNIEQVRSRLKSKIDSLKVDLLARVDQV